MNNEWNFLRAFACLCIVFLHSTTFTIRNNTDWNAEPFQFLRALLTFSTPAFILLSIIILANRYPNHIPKNFFKKRVLFILIPFVCFAFIDSLSSFILMPDKINLLSTLSSNLQGNYSGWFILVIFQFYFLHYFLVKWKFNVSRLWLPFVFLMFAYLISVQNGFEFFFLFGNSPKLSLLAWIGYFATAFLIGKNYYKISTLLDANRSTLIALTSLSALFIFLNFQSGYTEVNSRRLDLFPFVIFFSLALLSWGRSIGDYRWIHLISNHSFGIYLMHWQVQKILSPSLAALTPSAPLNIGVLFVLSFGISLFLVWLIARFPFGQFIVGQTNRRPPTTI